MPDGLFLDIRRIRIAHEFTLDQVRRCEYPHGRGSYGLVLALDGRAEYRFSGGERVTLTAKDLFLIPPTAAYSILTEEAFHHYTVNFDLHEDASAPTEMLRAPYRPPKQSDDAVEHCFRRLVSLWMQKRAGYEMAAIGCLYELFSLLSSQHSRIRSTERHRLSAAREYVEKGFARPISLSELAYLSNMSVTSFRREWKKHFGEAPLQYRDSLRLSYARELLGTGYYTVSEIAEKCGFEDVSYFVRFFKKKTGISPGEYKKNCIFETEGDMR